MALPADDRPIDPSPVHTDDLPATPLRDRNIPATAWIEAPDAVLLTLGDEIGTGPAVYKRRIGPWLLWRRSCTRRRAAYLAIDAADLSTQWRFDLAPDGSGTGTGPSGAHHERFRTWKEDLRDHGTAE
ncbi:MAG: hypothetical protein R2690_07595 [Acidimicrobiales bacterium]